MTPTRRLCRWCDGPACHKGSTAARIFDLLEDLGPDVWLTAEQLTTRLDRNPSTIRREAHRLAETGVLRRRTTLHRQGTSPRSEFSIRPARTHIDTHWPPTVEHGVRCSCGTFLPNPHRLPLEHLLGTHRPDHTRRRTT